MSRSRSRAVASVATLAAVLALPGLAESLTPEELAAHISLQAGASARVEAAGKVVYFDPFFDEKTEAPPADLILISHGHERHCETGPVSRILKADTVIVAPESCATRLKDAVKRAITTPVPGEAMTVAGLSVTPVAAYTPNHADHPKSLGGVGYVLAIGGVRVYHSGSTALVPETKAARADIGIIAFWNGYILSTEDAAAVARSLGAKIVLPTHCKPEDAVKLRDMLEPAIKVDIRTRPEA